MTRRRIAAAMRSAMGQVTRLAACSAALSVASLASMASAARAQSPRAADSLLSHGLLQRAEDAYYAASRSRPRDPAARFALGRYLLDRGAFRIGATLIDEAIQFGYDRSQGSALLARVYMNLGEYPAVAGLPAGTLPADEQALVRWLVAHPARIDSAQTGVLLAFTRTAVPGYVGLMRLRVNGQAIAALVSPRTTCGLRLADTTAAAAALHRFGGAAPDAPVAFAAADSIGFGPFVLRNAPIEVVHAPAGPPAVVCFGLLARYAPTFDPRANLAAFHVNGVAPAPSSRSTVAPLLDVNGVYSLLRSGVWSAIGSPELAALLGDHRWTLDPRRRQVTIEP